MTDEQMDQEADLNADQDETREAVFATVPTTREGRLALAAFADFHLGLTIGADWRSKAWHDFYGAPLLPLMVAIEAEQPDGEPADADSELMRLGRQFATARAREIAACQAAFDAEMEAEENEPPRPTCLLFREADRPFRLQKFNVIGAGPPLGSGG